VQNAYFLVLAFSEIKPSISKQEILTEQRYAWDKLTLQPTNVLAQSCHNKYICPHTYRQKNSDYSILSSEDHFNSNYYQQSCFCLFCISVSEHMMAIAEDTE